MDTPRTARRSTPQAAPGVSGGERATTPRVRKPRTAAARPEVDLADVLVSAPWLHRVRASGRLKPGGLPRSSLSVPAGEAQKVLRGVIRFVADIPADSSPVVVWQRDGSEVWVDASSVTLACGDGLVRVGVKLGCDQLDSPVVLSVPFKVGTPAAPSGLLMSTVDRLDGPDLVVVRWSDAVIAFGWEALLELARRLCAEVGKDAAGLPLIPGALAAAKDTLLIQPMARNDLSKLGG